MKHLFERTSSNWVRYSEYEWKAAEDGTLYLTPTKTAQPSIYDPLAEYQQIVLAVINIGRMGMGKKSDAEIPKAILWRPIRAFSGTAPIYHIALLYKLKIVWDFHSLMLGIQMMFRFMLTDSENPIRLCKHCTQAFVASRPRTAFCSFQCKNKHNVYKSRARKNNPDGKEQGND